jgi:hypothetical protein
LALTGAFKLFGNKGRTPAEILAALDARKEQETPKLRTKKPVAHTPRVFVESGEPSIAEELHT